jgi:glycosyltransferase involved in cell wall biosynthesis
VGSPDVSNRPPRLRVLILLNSLAPYGAENFVLNHAIHFDRERFELELCQLGGSRALAPRFAELGVLVHSLDEPHRFAPRSLLALARLLRERQVDVLQTHVAYAGIVGRFVGRAAGVPVLVSTEQDVRHNFGQPWRSAIDLTLGLAHGHVFITEAVRRSFARAHPRATALRFPTISNGVDATALAARAAEARASARAKLGMGEADVAFVNVARLVPVKGQATLLEAFARVRRERPETSLWLIGSGPLEAELRARAAALGGAVHFLGERLDVHHLLGAFDVYVHPSRREAQGIAVLEAMAAGLPVICSAVDGIPEFVRDAPEAESTGALFSAGNAAGLAREMLAVLADGTRTQARARRAQELMLREHDVRRSIASYERLYDALWAKHGKRG